jgi:myosin protein heavy chain
LSAFSRLAADRDAAERDAREKETKILSSQRETEELKVRIEELERDRTKQTRELEYLMSSKDDVGKNVHELERAKRTLEGQVGDVFTIVGPPTILAW